MIIRYARKQDSPQIKRLWAAAFGDDEPYFSWYFREVYRPQRTLTALDGLEIVACLQLAPYTISLHGHSVPAAYLVGVTTAEPYRRQGIGQHLLRYALAELSTSGFRLAMLYTDIPAYYTPAGFTQCYALRRLVFPALKDAPPPGWQTCQRSMADIQRLDRIYRKMCCNFDGYLLRNPENWRSFLGEHLCEGGGILVSEQAYLLWSKQEDVLYLREIGFTSRSALQNSLDFVQHFAATKNCAHLLWLAPQTAPVIYRPGEKVFPWVMARRLDLAPETDANTVAAETKALLGAPEKKLWINEMT